MLNNLENVTPNTATAVNESTLGYDPTATKREILSRYGVARSEDFSPEAACRARINYMKDLLRTTKQKGYVLGISGGVDSSTCGRFAQIACEELRAEGYQAKFYAVRLPAGVQFDEDDAQEALRFINPDETLTINIGESSNALNDMCVQAVANQGRALTVEEFDWHKGNIKSRLRMTAQYHLAGVYRALVVGSENVAECVSGFFGKFADSASDMIVLNGLNKNQVRLCAAFLGAPKRVWAKPPTADLEELKPGKLDEEGLGFPYEALDAFLEGKEISADLEAKIIATYEVTRHKRDPIVAFPG